MEKPPMYLLLFLLRIRRHSGEKDYFTRRFTKMKREKMAREAHMLHELHRRGFVALPEEKDEKVYDPLQTTEGNATFLRAGTEHRIPYATEFEVLPAGHYVLWELAFDAFGKVAWTAIAAVIGLLIGLRIK